MDNVNGLQEVISLLREALKGGEEQNYQNYSISDESKQKWANLHDEFSAAKQQRKQNPYWKGSLKGNPLAMTAMISNRMNEMRSAGEDTDNAKIDGMEIKGMSPISETEQRKGIEDHLVSAMGGTPQREKEYWEWPTIDDSPRMEDLYSPGFRPALVGEKFRRGMAGSQSSMGVNSPATKSSPYLDNKPAAKREKQQQELGHLSPTQLMIELQRRGLA